jgi:hypothetical protein
MKGYLRGRLSPVYNIDAINHHWSNIEGILDRLVDEKLNKDDIYNLVSSGEWVLWIAMIPETKEITTTVITSFIYYPQITNLRIVLLSGDNEDWSMGIEILEDFARANQCHDVEILGRKGWERTLKDRGYEFQNVTLSKRIT